MKASYKKTGDNFLPAIIHDDGRREVLYGDPLVNIATAKRYAYYAIVERNTYNFRNQSAANYGKA